VRELRGSETIERTIGYFQPCGRDVDLDDIVDAWERAHFPALVLAEVNPLQDHDGDGLTAFEEFRFRTDPHVADTDRDGRPDGAEVDGRTDPVTPDPRTSQPRDTDADGLPDAWEEGHFTDPADLVRARLEIHTGWWSLDRLVAPDVDEVHRIEFASFLLSANNQVERYERGASRDATVTASVSAVADEDDEANVEAVDIAIVSLEPQPQLAGDPFCLVLRTTVAALHAKVHAITYQVTVLTDSNTPVTSLPLDPDDAPKV
jgi:hypothetical protein